MRTTIAGIDYDVCDTCGAVGYGNASCDACVVNWEFLDENAKEGYLAILRAPARRRFLIPILARAIAAASEATSIAKARAKP